MEIFTLLETLEDLLEKSKQVPFSEKTIIDKNEFLDIIKEIRLKLPDELKEAKWIKEEREKIIAEAQKDADDIVKEAKNRIIGMIDEFDVFQLNRDICQQKCNSLFACHQNHNFV